MTLDNEKLTIQLRRIRDSSRRSILPYIHDLFTYLRVEAKENNVFLQYETDRKEKWINWRPQRTGDWKMPLDMQDRKSLAYDLYATVLERGDPGNGILFSMYRDNFESNVLSFQDDFFELLLEAINDMLAADVPVDERSDADDERHVTLSNDVFIVHGHDEAAKAQVANFVLRLGLNPIILHERPNEGGTIIEKLERESKCASFAVVILTPDDKGCASNEAESRPRARQNVVFEWGLFVGLLGRKRVCALCKGNVEILSDMQGVLWVSMDSAWQLEIAREMKAAGLTIDLNRLIG